MSTRAICLAAAGAACLAVVGGAAQAADGSVMPSNYTFPDGAKGFALASHGGVVNPGVLVGFNPQPDPPGDNTLIGLLIPGNPVLQNDDPGPNYMLEFAITGLGPGTIPFPAAPNTDGRTGFRQEIGGHTVDVNFAFSGPGPVDPASWVAFNPQPDPPGDVLGGTFAFGGVAGDPIFSFTVQLDGRFLTFSPAPEPAAWTTMILGFGLLGATLRRRGRRGLPSVA